MIGKRKVKKNEDRGEGANKKKKINISEDKEARVNKKKAVHMLCGYRVYPLCVKFIMA